MGDIKDLIRRLEAAAGRDYDIDAEIAAICHPTDDPRGVAFETGRDYPDAYTSSLDAALTLVPEGLWWVVAAGKTRPDEPLYAAAIYESALYSSERPPIAAAEHEDSSAIALCIAALKARTA